MRVIGSGISVELPSGWEGSISRSGALAPVGYSAAHITAPTVAHFANFPLPPRRADFGAEATELMEPGDVFVVLFEYDRSSVGSPLFSARGVPHVTAKDFDRNALQHGMPGQSGLQRFFTHSDRAFCLYVVVGSHIDRADAIGEVNRLLASLELT